MRIMEWENEQPPTVPPGNYILKKGEGPADGGGQACGRFHLVTESTAVVDNT